MLVFGLVCALDLLTDAKGQCRSDRTAHTIYAQAVLDCDGLCTVYAHSVDSYLCVAFCFVSLSLQQELIKVSIVINGP